MWLGVFAVGSALDYACSIGEADGDTLSECTRDFVRRHPLGDAAFTVSLFGGAEVLRRHILKQ